ncbi:hypothetical protein Ddc_12997 [Ditylenchus destructor]|nr:hypothetical protein Ddc_12997 [Ditylenchus destructor]
MTAKLLPLLARCRYLKVTNPPVPPIIKLLVLEDSAIREWRFHRATDLLLTNPLFFPNLVKFLFKELPYTGLERNSHAFSGVFSRAHGGVKKYSEWLWLDKVQLPISWQKVKPLSDVEVTISTAVSDETLVTNLLDMIIEAFNQSKKPGIFDLSWVCSGSRRSHTANLRPFIKTHPNPEIKDVLKLFVSDPTGGHFTIARQNADTFYNSMSSRIEFQ